MLSLTVKLEDGEERPEDPNLCFDPIISWCTITSVDRDCGRIVTSKNEQHTHTHTRTRVEFVQARTHLSNELGYSGSVLDTTANEPHCYHMMCQRNNVVTVPKEDKLR